MWDRRDEDERTPPAVSQRRRIDGDAVALVRPRLSYDRLYQAFPGLERSISSAVSSHVTEEEQRGHFPEAVIEVESLDFVADAHSDRNSLRMLD